VWIWGHRRQAEDVELDPPEGNCPLSLLDQELATIVDRMLPVGVLDMVGATAFQGSEGRHQSRDGSFPFFFPL
jgi:hypothetical protein